jgi:hypothetical protein
MATSPTTVPKQVTWGLLAAWAVHDLEELATMASGSRRIVARLQARYPSCPTACGSGLRSRPPMSPSQSG